MNNFKMYASAAIALAATGVWGVSGSAAETASDKMREDLRQPGLAERAGCTGIQRVIGTGKDVSLVVRTAIEIGYNSCQVITCALAGKPDTDAKAACEQVVRGAVDAGVEPDVIARCTASKCDPAAVAGILAATQLEPNYCYFSPSPYGVMALPPPSEPNLDRDYQQPQASPFSF